MIRQQSASPPNRHGQAQGKGKGKAEDKEGDAGEMAARSSRQAAETYAIDENPPPSFMQELPIVSIDAGGVLSAIGAHKLDEAALAALKELGNVVGDDRILLNSFVQTEYGYKKTVRNCETGHIVLRRFFGRGRENFRCVIFTRLGPQGKAGVIRKTGATFHVDDQLEICQDVHKQSGGACRGI